MAEHENEQDFSAQDQSATPPEESIAGGDAGLSDQSPPDATVESVESDNDARMWGMLCHISALAGFIGLPLGNVLGPLIFWLMKRNEMPFVDDQGKESLNFQITVTIAILICLPLMAVCVGFILLAAVAITALVFVIIAGIKANNGERYRYPWALRLIK